MEVGFDGFASVVDAVGGVQICPDRAMRDPMAGLNVKAGCQVVGSKQALAYVRTRAGGRGDLDRVERQQEFLGSLIDKSTSPAVLLNPFRSVPLLLRGTEAVAVDQAAHFWSLVRFPFAMRAIASGDGIATTVPVAGTGTVPGAGSVVQWDRERALALFEAIQRDQPVDGLVDQGWENWTLPVVVELPSARRSGRSNEPLLIGFRVTGLSCVRAALRLRFG